MKFIKDLGVFGGLEFGVFEMCVHISKSAQVLFQNFDW